MIKVGLTGSIGSGKTTVSKIFKSLGVPVFYADDEAKRLMNEDEILINAIKKLFGDQAYTPKTLNRKFIANIVFSDKGKLNKLNEIVHPATIKAAEAWMNAQTSPYAIKEAALLFEAGAVGQLNYVIGVYAPQAVRIQRIIARDNMPAEQILNREQNQMNEKEKLSRCNFVITNDDTQLLIPQVLAIHERLLKEASN